MSHNQDGMLSKVARVQLYMPTPATSQTIPDGNYRPGTSQVDLCNELIQPLDTALRAVVAAAPSVSKLGGHSGPEMERRLMLPGIDLDVVHRSASSS